MTRSLRSQEAPSMVKPTAAGREEKRLRTIFLEFEVWRFSGAWILELGAWSFSPLAPRPSSRHGPTVNLHLGIFVERALAAALRIGAHVTGLHAFRID